MGLYKYSALAAVATAAANILAVPAFAQVTHEDEGSLATYGANEAPVGRLTVSSTQSITGFGVDVDLNGPSSLVFLIFNSASGDLLYHSVPKAFADDGSGYKYSNPFSFTFDPGITYGLAATSSTGGDYFIDSTSNTVGAFNFLLGNQNVSRLTLDRNRFCCDVGTSLVLAAATSGVPEPATWAMMLVGFGAVGGALRRRQSVTTRSASPNI